MSRVFLFTSSLFVILAVQFAGVPASRTTNATTQPSGIGARVYATGGRVKGTILASDALYTSVLSLAEPKQITIGTNRETGKKFDLGTFKSGTELVFSLHVQETGETYFTGPGSRNPDGLPHANVQVVGKSIRIGWEDWPGGGNSDYNDHNFQFTGLGALRITSLQLNDVDNKPLGFLSGSPHDYYRGFTLIHGTIVVAGSKDDILTSLKLEVLDDGEVVATARLANAARRRLLVPFGDDGKIVIDKSMRLFALPSAEAAHINGAEDSQLTLRVKGATKLNMEGERDHGTVQLLVRYTGANRYGDRDAGNCTDTKEKYPCGGDDWVLPSVRKILTHFAGIAWGDMSNMNGGYFPPHSWHERGTSADGHFPGYNARNRAAAEQIIAYLNDDTHGSRIRRVYVTFTPAFRRAIEGVTLDDGRKATDVIKSAPDHETHFHFEF